MIVNHKRDLQVTVPRHIVTTPDISLAAKGLYAYLLSLENTEHVTLIAISFALRENVDDIRKAAVQLEALDYIEGLVG